MCVCDYLPARIPVCSGYVTLEPLDLGTSFSVCRLTCSISRFHYLCHWIRVKNSWVKSHISPNFYLYNRLLAFIPLKFTQKVMIMWKWRSLNIKVLSMLNEKCISCLLQMLVLMNVLCGWYAFNGKACILYLNRHEPVWASTMFCVSHHMLPVFILNILSPKSEGNKCFHIEHFFCKTVLRWKLKRLLLLCKLQMNCTISLNN